MKIGYDAKKIGTNQTGIGNYSRGVINGLARYFPTCRYNLYFPLVPVEKAMAGLKRSESIQVHLARGGWRWPLLRELWRGWFVGRALCRDGVDIYHGLSNELPFGLQARGIRTVVTIHDLIFLRYPETYTFIAHLLLKWKTRRACRAADRIVAISEQTKADITHYYHINPDKIRVVYQGCDAVFYTRMSTEERGAVLSKYGIPDGFLLTVGTFEPRKNHLTMLKAMTAIPDRRLVMVSKHTSYQCVLEQEARELGVANRVMFLNGVSNAELAALYQSCTAAIYLSFFEGFGIPVLEAMVSRAPVIAASGSCLEEVGGDACIYCPPFDVEALIEALQSVWLHPQQTSERMKRAELRAGKFSAEHVARDLMAVYDELL